MHTWYVFGAYEDDEPEPDPARPVRHLPHAMALLASIGVWVACRWWLDLEVWPVVAWTVLAWGWAAVRK